MSTTPYSRSLDSSAEANASGVSWPAVIAGAFVTAALVLILLSLGAGLGLSAISPWANAAESTSAIKTSAIIWFIVMEILSSAMGGYLAGRLRTRWTSVHSDEVYFRDTAHGFLAWSTALVLTAAFLASAATTMVGGAASSKGTSEKTSRNGTNPYFVDSLFRNGGSKDNASSQEQRAEADLIFENGLRQGALPDSDQAYLAQTVSAVTGTTSTDANQRVANAFSNAQQAAEILRKTTAHALLWMFIALLIGAFSASFAATIGGRQRDHVVVL